jgi:hypothetical protein
MSKSKILTEAPTTIIRVEDLIAKKDAEYPEDPAHNICNGAQDPVMTRAGNSGCVRIRKLCNSTDKLGSVKHNVRTAPVRVRDDSLDQDVNSVKVEERLKRQVCENEDGK